MDILAFSSIENEDFPNVILEAMSLALPVIATNVAGVPEQIDDGINGIIVAARDTKAMRIGLESLILREDLRASIGKAAHAKYCMSFSPEIAVRRYIQIYDSLASRGTGGRN